MIQGLANVGYTVRSGYMQLRSLVIKKLFSCVLRKLGCFRLHQGCFSRITVFFFPF